MEAIIPPPLRLDLKIRELVQRGKTTYVIKEPDKQEYYHFDQAQYQMLILFDNEKTLEQLVETFNRQSQQYEFDLEALQDIYDSCKDLHLLKRSRQEETAALLERNREERRKKILQAKGSLLFLRFHLVDPNAFFNRIIDHIRFLWSPAAVRWQITLVAMAFVLVLFQGERFLQDFNRIYLSNQGNLGGLLAIWFIALGAIALHECGHGLTCKHFGGDVHDMGFLFLAFQPCLYCNVNDAWLFEHKRHKIYVALAGVWVELLLAAFAALLWLLIDISNPLGFVAFVLMTISTASSLFINLNPLLKFDGYYILTDMLEMENLRQNSTAWFSWTLKRHVLRLDTKPPLTPSPREKRIYFIYGALVALYMALILSAIGILGYGFVSSQFGFLANLGFIYLFYLLMKKLTGSWGETLVHWHKTFFWSSSKRQKRTLAALVLVLLVLIFWQPQMRIRSQGIIESTRVTLYAPQDGFISYVGYDQQRQLSTEKKPFVLSLSSPELNLTRQAYLAEQAALRLQQTIALSEKEQAKNRQLLIELTLIEDKLKQVDTQLRQLNIAAPPGQWQVEAMPPQALLGRFFGQNTEILTLVAATERYIDVIVDQRDVYLLSTGNWGRIKLTGNPANIYQGKVTTISPVATLEDVEQSFKVRMQVLPAANDPLPPLGLSGDALIFGEHQPLWRHIFHEIRKILRADLWL
ncbi:HlyD family efflux transporter periplasmic adaptor subunit [Thalassomonas haliotis]|uniref:HlyD family efflux transporter periplasmic adaptor subunit n=1 Tax=Thalassomonas haliotis TaxID=485448 RepID=A0ABY7VI74_9GAMM|nr:HlyD family efflux transporter periplasmic adaptor subunit [Thalassomonas haliotis]WDE13161.1 HlyD family efflux transporter periplasmic adaptor subunit [Thalassomonas haliotis]